MFFRSRSEAAVEDAAKRTSEFSTTYSLPVRRPFHYVIAITLAMIIVAITATLMFARYEPATVDKTPLFTGCIAVIVAAIGWAVAGGITHRNTIRQNTITILFARFSQPQFGEAVERFHRKWGLDEHPRVSGAELDSLRSTGDIDDWRTATSVGYLLNYFELVATGVMNGDLDDQIVRATFRGVVCFYHDKCLPYIDSCHRENRKAFENLIKLRIHYGEP